MGKAWTQVNPLLSRPVVKPLFTGLSREGSISLPNRQSTKDLGCDSFKPMGTGHNGPTGCQVQVTQMLLCNPQMGGRTAPRRWHPGLKKRLREDIRFNVGKPWRRRDFHTHYQRCIYLMNCFCWPRISVGGFSFVCFLCWGFKLGLRGCRTGTLHIQTLLHMYPGYISISLGLFWRGHVDLCQMLFLQILRRSHDFCSYVYLNGVFNLLTCVCWTNLVFLG